MEFSIVILSKHASTYPDIAWSDWKDENRKKMNSEGDNWSAATLKGANIWDCLDLSLIQISEPTRQAEMSYAVICL
mgnify:CR=1 FL=1